MATTSFAYTGAQQSFTVPAQCTTIHVVLVGADGGNPNISYAGTGATVGFDLAVTPGDVLYVNVGGMGSNNSGFPGAAGGFNGGGGAGSGPSGYNSGGSGGGASDIRKGGTALSNRLATAGGGGGAANNNFGGSNGGGGASALAGTGFTGGGTNGGFGGTQAAGGASRGTAPGTAGALGVGGGGSNNTVQCGGAGGGGGYYGGGGGGVDSGTGNNPSGGGGGSSWAGGTGITGATSTAGVSSGTTNPHNGSVVFTYNVAPNAPTLTAPANNANIDETLPTTFTWNFSDPDPGDTQSAADFRWRVGSGAWTTVTGAATTAGSYTAAANAFTAYAGTSVEWQVRTKDALGAVGPWSGSSFFVPWAPPTAPAFSPVPAINSNVVTATITHGTGFTQNQMQVVNDVAGAPGSTVYATNAPPGSFSTPQTSATSSVPPFAYVNGTSYHVQERIAQPAGVWSPWVDSGAIVATLGSPPLTPTAVLGVSLATASISVNITNPGSDPHPPNHNDVYRTDLTHNTPEIRVATQVPLNSVWTDFLPALNVNYRYRVVAVTVTGASASSA